MKKFFFAAVFALLASAPVSANYISFVTGGDMAGITVTVEFDNQSTSPAIAWVATSADSGSAIGRDWSLSQTGNTFGDLLSQAWMFTNDTGLGVVSIIVDAWVGGFVFDGLEGDASGNGSGAGREFINVAQFDPNTQQFNMLQTTATFLNPIEDGDIFGGLQIVFASPELGNFQFFADTDAVADDVPVPAVFGLLVAALGFAGFARRK